MKDKDLFDILLRLEARITKLENHIHLYNHFHETSEPKIRVSTKRREKENV